MTHTVPPTDKHNGYHKPKDKMTSLTVDNGDRRRQGFVARCRLPYVTVSVCLMSMVWAMGVAYTSPALPNINEHHNPFHLSDDQQTWAGSIFTVGAMVGGLTGGYAIDAFGRKTTLVVAVLPHVLGWLVIVCSTSVTLFICGRALTGVFYGLGIIVVSAYMAETTPSAERGAYGSVQSLFYSLGMLIVYGLGCFLPWTWLAVAPIAVSALQIVLLNFVPETPRWLMANGYKGAAREALEWLQPGQDVAHELQQIEDEIAISPKRVTLAAFRNRRHWKPLLIAVVLCVAQGLCGIDYISFYTVSIFDEASGHFVASSYAQATIVGFFGVVGNILSIPVVDKYGRRTLLVLSGTVMAACMACLGAYYKIKAMDGDFAAHNLSWLPVVCLLIFQLTYMLGWGPIPPVVISEIFRTDVRGTAGSFCNVILNITLFLITKWPKSIESSAIHNYGLYWLFAAVSLLGVAFVIVFLPETKGRKLEEMDELFS